MGQKNIEISQRNVGPLQNYPVNMRDFYNVLICHTCSTPLEHYAVATILEQYPEQPEGNGTEAEAYRKSYDLMVPDMVIEDWEHYYEWLIERTEDEHIVIESIRRYNIVASAMRKLDWAGWSDSRGGKTYGECRIASKSYVALKNDDIGHSEVIGVSTHITGARKAISAYYSADYYRDEDFEDPVPNNVVEVYKLKSDDSIVYMITENETIDGLE